MKTTANNSRYLKRSISFFVFWIVLISALFFKSLQAQNIRPKLSNSHDDPNFPAAGGFNAGLLTTYTNATPPPAIIADATYGLTSKVGIGIMAGTTGALAVTGIKINAVLLQLNEFKISSRTVIVYYPERNGKFLFDRAQKVVMPWMLSMTVVDGERSTRNGLRYSLGVGLLETHCVEGMKKYFWGSSEESKVVPFEFFQTIQGSIAVPLSKKVIFRPEVILIMKDWDLIQRDVFRVSPVNPYLKFIYTF
jgi:hypothetical protein